MALNSIHSDSKDEGHLKVSCLESYSALFSSAAGSRIEVSEESQVRARAILGDEPMVLNGIHSDSKDGERLKVSRLESYSALFSSAAGSRLEVSEESQARARAILGDTPTALNGIHSDIHSDSKDKVRPKISHLESLCSECHSTVYWIKINPLKEWIKLGFVGVSRLI